jgi:uncharacterized protein
VTLGSDRYIFLTDRRRFVRVTPQLNALLEKKTTDGEAPNLPLSTATALLDAGLLSADTPLAQFNAVMRAKPRSSELALLRIITSYTCNLTCSYCFMLSDLRTDSRMRRFLPFGEAKQGIDLYFSRPHRRDSVIHFYGGEPLLHPQLISDCLDYIVENYSDQVLPKIITNGTLIGGAVHRLMMKHHFDLSVSMDGDRDAHDVYRVDYQGRSSYDKVLAGIRYFQNELGNNPKVLIIVGIHNIRRLPEVVETVLDLQPKAIALNFPRELYSTSSGLDEETADLSYWVEQYEKALDLCFDRAIPELYFADMLFAFLSGEPVMNPCAACGSQISIGPGAQVGPCQAFVASGQFTRSISLLKIEPRPSAFTDWENVSKGSSRKCTSCPIAAVCGGDCSFDRFNRTGSLHEPLEFHCDLRLKMATILAERAITGKPIGFAADHRIAVARYDAEYRGR